MAAAATYRSSARSASPSGVATQLPRTSSAIGCPKASGAPIRIGSIAIRTGDHILADADGVVVLPQDKAAAIVAEAERVMAAENQVRKAILDGMDPQQAYLKYRKF